MSLMFSAKRNVKAVRYGTIALYTKGKNIRIAIQSQIKNTKPDWNLKTAMSSIKNSKFGTE